jgi:branched-chain amino acid transport system substrate-binding protein
MKLPVPSRTRRSAWLALPVALALLVAGCSGDDDGSDTTTSSSSSATTTDSGERGTIVMGAFLPQTGALSAVAQTQAVAIQFALDDIEAAGGLLGQDTQLAVVDSTGRTDLSVLAAETLLDRQPAGVVGPVQSSVVLSTRDTFAAAGVPVCSPAATSPALNPESGQQDLFYRLSLPGNINARETAKQLVEAGSKSVSIAAIANDYGTTTAEYLRQDLEAAGVAVNVVSYAAPAINSPIDAPAIVEQLASTKPDRVVLATFREGAAIVQQALETGIPATAMWGLDAFFNLELGPLVSDTDQIEGFNVFAPAGQKSFFDRLFASQGDRTYAVYSPEAYDCTIVLALAMVAADSTDPAEYADEVVGVASGGEPCSSFADCQEKLRAGQDVYYAGVSNSTPMSPEGQATRGTFALASYDAEGVLQPVTSVTVNLTAEEIAAGLDSARQQAVTVSAIQTALTVLGFYDGPINGVWDTATEEATKALQTSLGLEPTGVWDQATTEAVQQALDQRGQLTSTYVTELQLFLQSTGFYDGPIDGVYSPAVTEAIKALQQSLGVPVTGVMDTATWKAAAAEYGQPAPPPTTVPPTTAPPTTPAPSAPPTTPAPTTPPTAAPTTASAAVTVATVILTNPEFSNLVLLAGRVNAVDPTLLARLGDPTATTTVFAPTNEALTPEVMDELNGLSDQTLVDVITYHWVAQSLPTSALATQSYPTLLEGTSISVTKGTPITVSNGTPDNVAEITVPDATADGKPPTNGAVQGIDKLLVPPGLQ